MTQLEDTEPDLENNPKALALGQGSHILSQKEFGKENKEGVGPGMVGRMDQDRKATMQPEGDDAEVVRKHSHCQCHGRMVVFVA